MRLFYIKNTRSKMQRLAYNNNIVNELLIVKIFI